MSSNLSSLDIGKLAQVTTRQDRTPAAVNQPTESPT
jgi:hypothetical protein